jgi:ADP-dependent NAD(P)H-hydrate dehydratase / NAD(P)H-hydrate epimerase
MRAAEARCFADGVSQVELMTLAGEAVARQVARFAMGRPVLVLAGPGNNGGDGFAVATMLMAEGLDVRVATLGQDWRGGAGEMRAAWTGPTTGLADARSAPVLVDGLFGIGLSRAIDGDVATTLDRLRADADFVLAIDTPSGLDADTGSTAGFGMRADATLALGAVKRGQVQRVGIALCGTLLCDPIGIDLSSDVRSISRPHLRAPGPDVHKYSRGLVAVIGGEMPGAARLAAAATARGGAGYVVLSGDDARVPLDAVVHRPEPELTKAAAVLIGPGLGRDGKARDQYGAVVATDRPLVLDGDALSLVELDVLATRAGTTILTPHGGEFARVFGEPAGDLIAATQDAARRSGAVVVHKGSATVIASPDGRAVVAQPPGWLSTAGTGDVLAGLVAARLAVTREPMRAACEAVWLHSRAATLAGAALVADELAMHIPAAISECL